MNKASGSIIGRVGALTFLTLMLGQAALTFNFTAFGAALPEMAKMFAATGHGDAIAQQSITIASLGIIAGGFLCGGIIARIGNRATILTSLILFGIAGSGGLFLHQALLLLGSRVVTGFAIACLSTACITAISDLFEGSERAKAIGYASGIGAGMALVGMLAGGALAQHSGWRLPFIQFPIFGFGGFLLALIGTRRIPDDKARTKVARSLEGPLPWMLYLLAVIATAVMFMGASQAAFLLSLDNVGNASTISRIMAVINLVGIPLGLCFGILERRLGLNRILILALASGGASLLLIGLVPAVSAAVLGAALFGCYAGLILPFLYHSVTISVAPETKAKAVGLLASFSYLGAFLNPFIFGSLGEVLGIRGCFVTTGIFVACMSLVVPMIASRHTRLA